MIGFTPEEFSKVREAIAVAHLFQQAITPLLKQRQAALNKQQRDLSTLMQTNIPAAFTIVAQITHREHRDPETLENQPAIKLSDIDRPLFRDELENVSALQLPDLVYEMLCALGELPMYHETMTAEPFTASRAATLMAWTWESGRRYGIQQAISIVECTTGEFVAGTNAALNQVLDSALDMQTPPGASTTARPEAKQAQPGPTLVPGDERSTDEGRDENGTTGAPLTVN